MSAKVLKCRRRHPRMQLLFAASEERFPTYLFNTL